MKAIVYLDAIGTCEEGWYWRWDDEPVAQARGPYGYRWRAWLAAWWHLFGGGE